MATTLNGSPYSAGICVISIDWTQYLRSCEDFYGETVKGFNLVGGRSVRLVGGSYYRFASGEDISAMWLVLAAVCVYALGYRFYSKFIAAKLLAAGSSSGPLRLSGWKTAAILCPRINGSSSAITLRLSPGPGPLVGPVLAAQFGYLPGTLWVLAGAVFGGCVQDFVILLFSVRRDGKSLTEMAREEVGRLGGFVAYVAIISIIVILLGVCALVVVNALKASPWGTFTIAMTIPIALLMGVYLRRLRPGKCWRHPCSDSFWC